MMRLEENKRLFLDMQEHPENYSDEQLEAMMDHIDRVPDADGAWERFEMREVAVRKRGRGMRRWLRFAALFAGAAFIVGISFATIRIVRYSNTRPAEVEETASLDAAETLPTDTAVRFDNVQLDSILSAVSDHYGKTVIFREKKLRRKMLIMTWRPGTQLADFIDRLNAFDGISVSLEGDTIIVSQTNDEEEEP